MTALGWPILLTLLLWWFGTGVILYLDSLRSNTYRLSMIGATIVFVFALYGLAQSSAELTASGACKAFGFGLAAWGWQLAGFYLGYITGPRRTACEPQMKGWRRFVEASRTSLYHEALAGASALLIAALIWNQPNQTGLWTFLLLWWMHVSAKLNIYFGVPNLSEDLLPQHLNYLLSFMRRRPMNLFFPVSVSVSTVLVVILAQRAMQPQATLYESASDAILATLMMLGIVEHWLLVTPLQIDAIWRWRAGADEASSKKAMTGVQKAQKRALVVTEAWRSSATGDESDYPDPRTLGLESWSPRLPSVCDAFGLRDVLDLAERGAFGGIECLKGVVRTKADWIRFEFVGEKSKIDTFAPDRRLEPLVVAMGRQVDYVRLQAAFDSCEASR
jgi:putative photosynthetic complex assembly protein 2